MRPLGRLATAAATCSACLLATAAVAGAAGPTVTLDSGLTPAFSTSVPNYMTSCGTKGSVTVNTTAASGWSVQVDGGSFSSKAVTKTVALTPGQRFRIAVRKSGKTTTASIRCVPDDFPRIEVTGTLPAAFPLFAFANISGVVVGDKTAGFYAVVADRNGIPVWWRRTENNVFNVMGMKGGYIAVGHADGPLKVYRPNGTILKSVRPTIGQPDAHEAIPTSRGTFYLGATSERSHIDLSPIGKDVDGYTLDSNLEEVSASGTSLWSWRSADHFLITETLFPQTFIPLTDTSPSPTPRQDIAHINSIEDDGNGGIIASFRNTSAIYDIDKSSPTGQIRWKFGGTNIPGKSLTVIGDDNADLHLGGQHDARLNPDGTLSVFDNGWGSNHGARVTRWRIDAKARTATLIESLADKDMGRAQCCGSARRGSDGSWLVNYGFIPYIRGYDSRKRQVFQLHFGGGPWRGFTYRATPIPATQLRESTLISGMDSMNAR